MRLDLEHTIQEDLLLVNRYGNLLDYNISCEDLDDFVLVNTVKSE